MKKFIFLILMVWSYACTDEGKNSVPKSDLNGTVFSVTENPLKGVTVDIYKEDGSGTPLETLATDNKGLFSISLDHGTYHIRAVADGYQAYEQTVTVEDNTAPLSIALHGEAMISGSIIDSQTGAGLAGATVSFFRGNASGRISESVDHGVELTVVTDNKGAFEIHNGPTGAFVAKMSKNGFFIRKLEKLSFEKGSNEMERAILVDIPDPGAIRIVLTWGATPSDLDSHLTGPDELNRFHMYWGEKNPTEHVSLDVDDQEQYGPETTTIASLVPGLYRYSVHNYIHGFYEPEGGAQIAASPAVVEVYDSKGMLHAFTAPPVTGEATTWRVFELSVTSNSSTLTPTNSYADIGTDDEDGNNFRNKRK